MPLKRREGYRFEYQPDVPGLPPGAFVGTRETKTFNCCHCRRTVLMNPERTRDRNLCHKHDLYTCDAPGCVLQCTDYDDMIELALKHPALEVPFLSRGMQGEVLFDIGLFRPTKSYRQRPREI